MAGSRSEGHPVSGSSPDSPPVPSIPKRNPEQGSCLDDQLSYLRSDPVTCYHVAPVGWSPSRPRHACTPEISRAYRAQSSKPTPCSASIASPARQRLSAVADTPPPPPTAHQPPPVPAQTAPRSIGKLGTIPIRVSLSTQGHVTSPATRDTMPLLPYIGPDRAALEKEGEDVGEASGPAPRLEAGNGDEHLEAIAPAVDCFLTNTT